MHIQDRHPHSTFSIIFRVISGNFLEMYDFFLFGIYASYIAQTFFPVGREYISLMLTFATFGAGFLMRPLGAIFLGGYIDHIGRRKGLICTLGLMALGTAMLAFTPSYATLGWPAPILVLAGRLLQGFSAGVELGGVSVYLSEIATPGRKGFYVSWQSASQQIAIIFSAALGYFLSASMSAVVMADWGWRIPFFIGVMIVPILFHLRRSLPETAEFMRKKQHLSFREIVKALRVNWSVVLSGMMLIVMTTVSFYLIAVYIPTLAKRVMQVSLLESLLITVCVGVSNLIWIPVMGYLSDVIGRWPIMILFSGLALLTAYPALHWLVSDPIFTHIVLVELWLSFLYGSYNGATVVALTEVIPVDMRTTGFSLAYSLATAIFGGFTPLVSTWLIEVTGDKASPGCWMALAGAIGLIATVLIYTGKVKVK